MGHDRSESCGSASTPFASCSDTASPTAGIAMAPDSLAHRPTLHDLRTHYATQHKERTGQPPDPHASPSTTARVYERSGVSRRNAL